MLDLSLKQLTGNFAHPGKIEWLGVRPQRQTEMLARQSILLDSRIGIIDDHYAGLSGKRQVTLIQHEHLSVIAAILHKQIISPDLLRRNICVSGLNLLALKDRQFCLGDTVLEFTGLCHPCSRMEKVLGTGGYNAMRGHGGITARVLQGGIVHIGDICTVLN